MAQRIHSRPCLKLSAFQQHLGIGTAAAEMPEKGGLSLLGAHTENVMRVIGSLGHDVG